MVTMGRGLGPIVVGLAAIAALIIGNITMIALLYGKLPANEHTTFMIGISLFDAAVIAVAVWLMVNTKEQNV